jgi:hypothetical protein
MYGPTELIKIGADPASFKKFGIDEYHGPCPMCGGRDRFVVFTARDFPHWNFFCRQCHPDNGWLDEINPNLKENMTPEEINTIKIKELERRVQEIEHRQEKQEKALEELRREQSWLKYHDNMNYERRRIWSNRGIPDDWQTFWLLGYCENFSVRTGYNEYFSTPTLSIPIRGYEREINNVKHRLLKVPPSGGKYRQEKTGVPAAPFISLPGVTGGSLFIAEGEIKAMVTCITIDEESFQVAGLPSSTPSQELLEVFKDHEPIYLCLDPDIEPDKTADLLGRDRTKIIRLPMKIDDAILAGALDKNGLKRIMRMAR